MRHMLESEMVRIDNQLNESLRTADSELEPPQEVDELSQPDSISRHERVMRWRRAMITLRGAKYLLLLVKSFVVPSLDVFEASREDFQKLGSKKFMAVVEESINIGGRRVMTY